MFEEIAVEAMKTLAVSSAGATATGAGRILDLVRRKFAQRRAGDDVETLLAEPDRLEFALRELVDTDSEFAGQLGDLLARPNESGRPRPVAPAVAGPYLNYDRERASLGTPGVHVVHGPPGSGKTSLVCQVAHEQSARFPDGQLYLDLARWREDNALRRSEIAAHVLDQLGAGTIAANAADLWEQYRAFTARQRFLLAFDNVENATDLDGLVPPSPSAVVLAATTRAGDELSAAHTHLVPLTGLEPGAAGQLLAAVAGPAVAAEGAAATALIELCDRMPFALRMAGTRIRRSVHPHPVATVLAGMRAAGVLNGADAVRQGFEQTFAELSQVARRLCVALPAHPGPDFTAASAEALVGEPCEAAIQELADSQFLAPSAVVGRYRLYNLARESAARHGTPDPAAADRILAYYRDRAVAADLALGRDRLRRYRIPEAVPGPEVFGGYSPIDWLDAEHAAYGALVRQAHDRGRHEEVTQICGALETLMVRRGRHRLFVEINRWGAASAEQLRNPLLEARIRSQRGRAYLLLHEFARADPELRRALELLDGTGDAELRSSVCETWGRFHEERGEYSWAAAALGESVALDRSLRVAGRRALGIHARMLANVQVKAARADLATALLDEAIANTDPNDHRNVSRVFTVRAKALLALRQPDGAAEALRQAWILDTPGGASQYWLELGEIDGDIAAARGDWTAAKQHWGAVWTALNADGHPREAELRTKLTAR